MGVITADATMVGDELNIPGLTLRNWRDDADYEAMRRVLFADKHSLGMEEAVSTQELKEQFESMAHMVMKTGAFLLEHHGQLIAYKTVRKLPEASGVYCYNHHGFVLPEWKERGIGGAMIRHSEQVLRAIAAEDRANEKYFQVFCQSVQTGLINLLESSGYRPVRYFYEMLRPDLENIPEHTLPQGIEERPVEPDQMRSIWNAAVEAFKEHWGETEHTEEDYERWLKRHFVQPELWRIAWDGDRVVGLVLNYEDEQENLEYKRKRGKTEDIATLKGYRGRGIAQALIVRGLRQFRELGYTEASLEVDSENATGALRLYEKLGYRPITTLIAYRKPMSS
jgi:ribosomal protein S18 acetylase RimI-like enzyme